MRRTVFDKSPWLVGWARTGALGACLLAGAGLPVVAADAAHNQLLSEKPSRAAAAAQFEARTSTIQPSLDIPYGVVADAANAAADRFAGPRSGRTRIGCSQVGLGSSSAPVKINLFHGCVDFDWHVNASRNGSITATRDGAGVAVAVPVKFTGNGGFSGDLAKAVQMNNKDFSGSFVVSISGTVRPDKQFCPKLEQAVTHFAWGTPPDIDVIGRSCLDAGNGLKACIGPWKFPAGALLTDQINRSLASQVSEINAKIPCDRIRGQLKQIWKTWSLPISLGNSPVFYVNIQPKSLSIPGVIANDDSIKLVARLETSASVADVKAPDMPPGELPDNTPLDSPAGKLSLAVPLAIPYPVLATAAAENFLGKPIKAGAKAAGSAITATSVEFFPSNDRLAVGVTFRVDEPRKLRGQTGTVWFTAAPSVENSGHLIRLSNVTLTRKIGNPLWALSPAIGSELPQAIGKAYAYDFSPLVRDADTKLKQAIGDPKNTGGVKIEVANDDFRLGRTALLPDNFVVEGLLDADVSARLQGTGP